MSLYDPISLEYIPINDFINSNDNNIVILFNNNYYGLNKSMITFSNEMKKCIIVNNQLLKQKTYADKSTYFNIGFFINKKILVDVKDLNKILKKNKIFELKTITTPNDLYINKEFLELSTIGLKGLKNKSLNTKQNIPYNEDVYFNELISNVLKIYSGNFYKYMNAQLLNNNIYNNTDYVDKATIYIIYTYFKINIKTNIELKNIIDIEINKVDKAFIEAAPRYENNKKNKIFYRGMRVKYINTDGNQIYNIGDKVYVQNFTSITTSKAVANSFAGNYGYVYTIYLDEGLPYINMITNTMFKKEKEILLPRNIIFELISKNNNEYVLLAKKYNEDQFKIKTGCLTLDLYNIIPSSIKVVKEPKFVFMDFGVKTYPKNNTDTKQYIKDLETKYNITSDNNKHFIILVGKPGAGKSYFIKNNLEKHFNLSQNNFIILNPDDLQYYNTDFVKDIGGDSKKGSDYIVNEKTLKLYANDDGNIEANMNATLNTLDHIRNSMQNTVLPYFLNSNKNIIYDSACSDARYCNALVKQFILKGFKPSIICVDTPNEIAFKRAKEHQKNDGRFMSDDYLNKIYKEFNIIAIKTKIISNIQFHKIIDNNTKSVPIENIAIPKLKRCPNGTYRDKKTKECVAKTTVKEKLPRCPKGTRRNPKTQLCEPKE